MNLDLINEIQARGYGVNLFSGTPLIREWGANIYLHGRRPPDGLKSFASARHVDADEAIRLAWEDIKAGYTMPKKIQMNLFLDALLADLNIEV